MRRSMRDGRAEPGLSGIDLNGPDRVAAHRRILDAKPSTRRVFLELYRACLAADRRYLTAAGPRVEIGAGSGFFREVCPGLIVTDVAPATDLDRVVDAMAMPFADGSLRAVF